jgi:hypothetical protein
MTGFLTHNPNIEPENKEYIEQKEQTTSKKSTADNKPIEKPISIEPKTPRKTNVLRALLIGLLLFGLLAGAFVVYDKYQKGELKLDNLNVLFLINKDTNNNSSPLPTMDTNSNRNISDTNSNKTGLIDSNS